MGEHDERRGTRVIIGSKWMEMLNRSEERAAQILLVAQDYEPGRSSLVSICKSHGVSYQEFRRWIHRLSSDVDSKPRQLVPDFDDALPEEKIYAAVFNCPIEEAGQFMPDDAIDAIRAALETIKDNESKVIWSRFVDGNSLEETGERYGITRERVRQIEVRAIKRLRHPTRMEILKYGREVCALARKRFEQERDRRVWELETTMLRREKIVISEPEEHRESIDPAELHIEQLGLGARAFNALARANLRTVGDLRGMSYNDLTSIRNMGAKTASTIVQALEECGFVTTKDGLTRFKWVR